MKEKALDQTSARKEDRLGMDDMTRTARIEPSRLDAPAYTATIEELRDVMGHGLPLLTDEVCNFLGVQPDELACVSSSFHIIYHPLVCMALAADGLLMNYAMRITNFDYQHKCPPRYVNIPISLTATMKCLSEGALFLTTPRGLKFVVRMTVNSYSGVVDLNVHVPADRTGVADHFFSGIKKFIVENNIFRGQRITPNGGFLNVAHYGWGDLILSEEKKYAIRRNIVDIIAKQGLYEKNGVAMKRGIMFYGPPGTGKTLTGKVLASQMEGVTFIWVTPNHIHGAESMAQIYGLARELAPTIVFIEDIDLIARDRSVSAENPVLCELMNQLDGIQENRGVITIVTTNYPELIEDALQNRPGRFDRRIEFCLPDPETRRKMLAMMLDGRVLDKEANPVDIKAIALMCGELSPSHMREIVNTAVMNAIDDESLTPIDIAIINQKHLVDAVHEVLENCPDPPKPGEEDGRDVVSRDYDD